MIAQLGTWVYGGMCAFWIKQLPFFNFQCDESDENDESIEKYEPEALNKILEEFYSTIRKKDGEDYEPDSLRVMATAIDRYLSEKEYKHSREKPGNKATRQR